MIALYQGLLYRLLDCTNNYIPRSSLQSLVFSTVIDAAIGICLAVPPLIAATMNVIIGLMATAVLACMTASTMIIIPMFRWKLGVGDLHQLLWLLLLYSHCLRLGTSLAYIQRRSAVPCCRCWIESLAIPLALSLAADSVAEFAQAYSSSNNTTQMDRTRDALREVGSSAILGAVPAMTIGICLLCVQTPFFFKFGIFLLGITVLSRAHALVFFATAISIIGPEENIGSVTSLLRCQKEFFKFKPAAAESEAVEMVPAAAAAASGSAAGSTAGSAPVSSGSARGCPPGSSSSLHLRLSFIKYFDSIK